MAELFKHKMTVEDTFAWTQGTERPVIELVDWNT